MEPILEWAVLVLLSAGATRVLLPQMLRLLVGARLVRSNYRGRDIPVAAGIAPLLAAAVVVVGAAAWGLYPRTEGLVLVFVLLASGMVGLGDDVLGDGQVRGLRGHITRALRGELTTGGLKALYGILVAAAAALLVTRGFVPFAVGTLLIAAGGNALNILDLRPGRAVKGFLVGIVLVGLFAADRGMLAAWLPLVAAVLVYAPADLRARAMLGDVGANALGAALGLAVVLSWTLPAQSGALGLLIVLHIYTERVSLSETIERIPLLRYLDQLGRRGE